jgi:DNA-binding LacI/PurR family transcriptional regulator
MKDVAAAAGVSTASVSNAYNRPYKLSPAQREHVLSVARELGYGGPHPGASSLRTGSAGAFGLMITDWLPYAFEDPATVMLMQGIAQAGHVAQMSLTLLPVGGAFAADAGDDNTDDMWPSVRRSLVDGFLIYSLPDGHPAVDSALRRNLPIVCIDAPCLPDTPFVGIDDERSARSAAEHLLELGHTKIGVLVDRLRPDGVSGLASQARIKRTTDGVARARLEGYAKAFKTAGIAFKSVPVVEAGGFLAEDAGRAASVLLARGDITAVLATTDLLALAALDHLEAAEVSVPDEMSVIGFDDLPAAATRGLTTVAQPLVEKGRRAAEALLQLLDDDVPGRLLLPTQLKVRSSTGPPPARGLLTTEVAARLRA